MHGIINVLLKCESPTQRGCEFWDEDLRDVALYSGIFTTRWLSIQYTATAFENSKKIDFIIKSPTFNPFSHL